MNDFSCLITVSILQMLYSIDNVRLELYHVVTHAASQSQEQESNLLASERFLNQCCKYMIVCSTLFVHHYQIFEVRK